jgi:hypothetical protein
MKKFSNPPSFTLFILIIFFSSRTYSQVFSDQDRNVDLNKFKTYAWIAPGDSVLNRQRPDKVFSGYIMHTANLELKAKGISIDTIRPSALFVFHTNVQNETRYSQSPSLSVGVGVAGPGYYVGGMAPVAGGEITESTYQKGSLTFEMYDTQTGHLVWTGGYKKDFSAYSDDVQKIISGAVKKIFKKLPIKLSKKK